MEPAISKAYSTPPPVAALTSATMSGSRALKVSVAPSSRAKASLCSDLAMATIRRAPAATAPSREARPTPPSPITATEEPAGTWAVLNTAPTPVSTAQPNRAASFNGRSLSTLTRECRDTVA